MAQWAILHCMEAEVLDIIEIGVNAFPSARGRKAKPLALSKIRDLTQGDAERLAGDTGPGAGTPPIKRIRATHHALARLIAQGVKDTESSMITGYCPSRISVLKQDPGFAELIEYYRGQVEEKFLDTHERLAKLGQSFIDEIQERLEDQPEDFSLGQLYAGAELCLDRSSAPPKGKGPAGNGSATPTPTNIAITFVSPPATAPLQTIRRVDVLELEAEDQT